MRKNGATRVQADDLARVLTPRKLRFPRTPRVVDVQYKPYVDSTGDEALRVTVVLADNTTEEQRTWRRIAPIEQAIFRALRRHGVELWPYVRFQTQSEMKHEAKGA
jgi:hypothetical protein